MLIRNRENTGYIDIAVFVLNKLVGWFEWLQVIREDSSGISFCERTTGNWANVLRKRKRKYCFNKPSVTDESGKFITSSKFKCFKNARSSGRLKFSLNLLKSFFKSRKWRKCTIFWKYIMTPALVRWKYNERLRVTKKKSSSKFWSYLQ